MSLFRLALRLGAPRRKPYLRIESLEDRTLLSIFGFAHTNLIKQPAGQMGPLDTPGPTGYTPAQIRHAYGFDQINFNGVAGDGSGTTIAIVDAFDDPNIASDLHQFDTTFHLSDPVFTKLNQSGGATYPAANSGWASEIALDVEWSHAIAPKANILLVEANDNSTSNLFSAVRFAANQPGVVAVSMSWGGGEDPSEIYYDSLFLTPSGHQGVTFLASSGDNGSPVEYPSISPNVLSVGGTTLNLDGQGNILTEYGWDGSGGGISGYEAQPSYQTNVVTQTSSNRTNPDVAYDADPYTGFPVYDSYNNGTLAPWSQFGGTSDAAPQWAALVAIANQGRAAAGLGSLNGRSQLLPLLYQVSQADFHDTASGSSGGYPIFTAGAGYDLVTGRGTPVAPRLVADLVGTPLAPTATHFSISGAPVSTTAGSTFTITVTALDQNNNPVTGYLGTVHLSSTDTQAGLPPNYPFTTSDRGKHTFMVTLRTAGSDTIKVSDASTSSIAGSATVSVSAAKPSKLAFGQQPTNAMAGSTITPAVTVRVLDAYGNPVTSDNTDQVGLTLINGATGATLSGTMPVTVSNGMATFSNLSVNLAGSGYALGASAGGLAGASSSTFTIAPAPGKPDHLAFVQQPTNAGIGAQIAPAVTVEVLDANNLLVANDNTDQVSLALTNGPTGATLSGTSPVTVSGGLATFNDLSVNLAGTGYTLVASSGSLNSATSASFSVVAAPSVSVIEDFEHSLTPYRSTSFSWYKTTTPAAHDGAFGLDMSNSYGWIYRTDAGAQVQQGETLSVWVQATTFAVGRAYFGFGASASGTLSLVMATDTHQLILQDNSGFGFTNLAATTQVFSPSHWYRLEVAWGVGGSITGRVYDSTGTTLLASVQATDNRVTAGGIAFLATSYDKYFDTVTVSNTASPHTVALGNGASPSNALGAASALLAQPGAETPPLGSASETVVLTTAGPLAPLSQGSDIGGHRAVVDAITAAHPTESGASLDTAGWTLAWHEQITTDAYFATMSMLS
ncbi:MAG TPA: S53 family peptidase [Gemmataceae bacterium]|nr:S53 family peptidase [Gemmataceae bacterium]